jgi:multidrug efflux pump subunit AcrA (membrane-fusion protein)
MKKNNWFKRIMVAAGTALAAAVLMFGPSLLVSGDENRPEQAETPLFSVKTASVEKRTLRAFLEVNGDIVNAQQADVFPDVSGKLVRVNVALGARVRKGDVIAEVDPSKPGAAYMKSPVYAPISGTVSKAPLPVGTTVNAGSSIAVISAASSLEISARIPEREIAGLETGLKAEVSLQAYPGEIFAATVTHVSPVLDSASRTKLVNLRFEQDDSRINAGMFATVRINTRTYDEVITIPAAALVSRHGESLVYVLGSSNVTMPADSKVSANAAGAGGEAPCAEARIVAAGVTLDGWTEIKSGLREGETLVVQGQQLLSGGEALRIVGKS